MFLQTDDCQKAVSDAFTRLNHHDEKAMVLSTIAYTAIGIIDLFLWCAFHQMILIFR